MSVLVMPNVFVIPPEEDNESPFCCFDAADPLQPYTEEELELEGPGSALEIISRQFSNTGSPVFHRGRHSNVVMPRRSDGRSIEEVLTSENEYQDPDITIRGANPPGDDSEIIEIIKVRRHTQNEREIQQPPPSSVSEPTFKPSKSFKSRASRAYSSIKNVGRSVSRSRIPPADNVSSDAESSRAPSPVPSRRASMIFSSLFSHSPSLNSRSSFDSFNEPTPSSPIQNWSSDPLDIQLHSPSSAEMQGFVPYPDTDEEYDGEEEIQTTPRASDHPSAVRSPSPTKSSRRRFSVLNLFSASKDSEIPDAGPSVVISSSTPTLPSPSRTDSTESSASSGPATPVDDTFPEPLPSRPSTSLLKRLPSFTKSPRKPRANAAPVIVAKPTAPSPALEVAEEADLSFGEIRLDSFHFDELSFDASRF